MARQGWERRPHHGRWPPIALLPGHVLCRVPEGALGEAILWVSTRSGLSLLLPGQARSTIRIPAQSSWTAEQAECLILSPLHPFFPLVLPGSVTGLHGQQQTWEWILV